MIWRILILAGIILLAVVGGMVVLMAIVFSVGTATAPLVAKVSLRGRDGRPIVGRKIKLFHSEREPYRGKEVVTDENGAVQLESTLMWGAVGAFHLPAMLLGRVMQAPLPVDIGVQFPEETPPMLHVYRIHKSRVEKVPTTLDQTYNDGGNFTRAAPPVPCGDEVRFNLTPIKQKSVAGWQVELTLIID